MNLHDYQVVGRSFLQANDRAALLLDMGLGKTAIALTALEPRHLPALVVAPKRVAETVWGPERDLWRPDLTIAIAAGDRAARGRQIARGADITVIGRDNLRDIQHVPYRTLVLDELSSYKSRQTVRWRAAREIARRIPHVWGLTGTPAPNGLLDLWAQIGLLDGGERLGRTIGPYRDEHFRERYRLPNGHTIYELRPGHDVLIHKLIEDICLSMGTEGRVALPPVTDNHIAVRLPARARRAYDDLRRELVADLSDINGGEIHSAMSAAQLSNRLCQVAAGFLYNDEQWHNAGWTPLHLEKTHVVEDVIEESQRSPVFVFYRYRAELEMLQTAISSARTIDEPHVIAAWNRGEVPVLLAHPQSAGHGLNLQHGGHTVVWTSPTWSLEEWEQGNKRFIRQGQQHPVVIHQVLADDTIDHVVLNRVDGKAAVQRALLEHLESPL